MTKPQGAVDILLVEDMPADAELINAMFLTAHTIKGSGDLFGRDHVAAFTHNAANVLDKVCNGELIISPDLGLCPSKSAIK